MSTNVDQTALGYDEAKISCYKIMSKYFPNIETSQSDLVNAFMSGMALIYAMFQVFAKLLQNELYVSTATELESLYKLIPFVGITLNEPTTLKTENTLTIQNQGMTVITDPILYLLGTDPFTDTAGNKFYLRNNLAISKKVYEFSAVEKFRAVTGLVISGRFLSISLSKYDEQGIPLSFYDTDSALFEIPYFEGMSAILRRVKVLFNKTTYPYAVSAIDGDTGAASTAVNLGYSKFYPETGHLEIYLNNLLGNTFDSATLYGLPINATYTQRSAFRRDIIRSANIFYYIVNPASAYMPYSIFNNASFEVDPTSVVAFTEANKDQILTGLLRESIDVSSLKLTCVDDSAIVFDFANAEELSDVFWGTIYKTTVVYNSVTYAAYILDKNIGLIAFEDAYYISRVMHTPGNNYTVDFTGVYKSKAWLTQYEKKAKVITPATDFDFNTMTYILEDADYILFDQLSIKINDTLFSSVVFEQVDNIVTVQGTTAKTYFSVIVLSPTKVKIRFESSVLTWESIENLSIGYNTVKQLSSYAAGIIASGPASLEDEDKVAHAVSGVTVFNFDAANNNGQVGVAGIPTVESLRSSMEKAAYTLDNIVNQTNYEAAIQTFYISQGWDARVKVFKYEDFGTLFVNWTAANFVFFVGLLNKYPNANFILTVPSDIGSTPVGGAAHVGQYTRAQLAAALSGNLTDTTLSYVKVMTDVNANELNSLGIGSTVSLRAKMVLTNYLLTASDYILLYAIYFKVNISPKDQYTFTQASTAVKQALESLFNWEDMQLARGIAVSDIYALCDGLPEVDKLLFVNFSHFKNSDTANLRVQDISYKTVLSGINVTMYLNPTSTGNKIQVRTASATIANMFSAESAHGSGVPANSITAPTGGTFVGLFTGSDTVNTSGFTIAGNNGLAIRVVSVGSADGVDYIELNGADITLTDELNVGLAEVRDATSLLALGMVVGRRISITGFGYSVNNVVGALITTASASEIYIDTADATLITEPPTSVTVTDNGERMVNPLWDFSTVTTDRKIKIDILALGGIETTQY